MSFLRFLHPPSRRRDQGWGRPMKGYGLNKYIFISNIIYFNKIKHLSLGLPFGYYWPMAWIIPSLPCHRGTPCKKVKRSKSPFKLLAGICLAPRGWGQMVQLVIDQTLITNFWPCLIFLAPFGTGGRMA